VVELSTPTAPGHGIDSQDGWHASDMRRWWVPCPHCRRFQVITFAANVEPWLAARADQCQVYCHMCKKPISDGQRAESNARGRWEPDQPGAEKRGYHLSQFNSPTQNITKIMENYFAGQREPKRMRAFYNNNLGEPYVALGDQVTPEMLDACRDSQSRLGGIPESPPRIGVDVGHSYIHLVARVKTRFNTWRLWDVRIFKTFNELDKYLSNLTSFIAVVDAHPEKREVEKLSIKWNGRVWMGFEKDSPQQPETAAFGPDKFGEVRKVNIDRTMALDQIINDLMLGRMVLPPNARQLGEHMPNLAYNGFYYHHCQMVRVEEDDANGRVVARWKKNKNPDHFHHANLFSWVATMKDAPMIISPEMHSLVQNAGGFV
jgi:hypothetical protein